MPFLRDEGPPVSPATIQRARETFQHEYGYEVVHESDRLVLLVRVPKARPDYLRDLAEVALHVAEDTLSDVTDVLLVGDEKVARMEPQRLRDHVREQRREDEQLATETRRRLDRTYGQTFVTSPNDHQRRALALRIPKASVADFSPDDVVALRHVLQTSGSRFDDCRYGYILADRDHERLNRRTLFELAGVPETEEPVDADAPQDEFEHEQEPAAAAAPAAETVRRVPVQGPSAPEPEVEDPDDADLRAVLEARNAPPPAPAAPLASPDEVEPEETYEIISRPKPAAAAPAPEPAPVAPPAAAPVEPVMDDVEEEETYEIISRPKTPPAAPQPAAAEAPAPSAPAPEKPAAMLPAATPALSKGAPDDVITEEYEVVSGRKPAPAPAPEPAKPAAASAPAKAPAERVGRGVPPDLAAAAGMRAEETYEIISRPPRKDPEPEPEPAGVTLNAAQPVPTRTKEYEIIGRQPPAADATVRVPVRDGSAPSPFPPTPGAAAASPAAPLVRPPPDVPASAALIPGLQKAVRVNGQGNGNGHAAPPAPVPAEEPAPAEASAPEPAAEPVPEEPVVPVETQLAMRLRAMDYEVVESVRAQNVEFAFAAHKPDGGRRILARVVDAFDAEAAAGLAPLVEALGAEVCLVLAARVGPGTRLATWGTRLQVLTPDEARALEL